MPDPEREVRRLHEVIEEWYRGDREAFGPFADALADDFQMVGPDGAVEDRDTVVGWVREGRDSHADDDPPFVIEIRNVEGRAAVGDTHLVRYEEHQRHDGDWEALVSTVLLREADDAPAGLEWVHLHETDLPE